ncbi:HAD domain-containing protein [Burkholderia cepacia]|uniref:HAD domain-containing protein n=1 Tax=Burkholderia cepacia TaxID=292 RepID=UPI002ABDF9F2|nr:HAD domain-containing protein [Burkholderia cepacia]
MSGQPDRPLITFDNFTPTLFVGGDGTLHRGNGLLQADGSVSLDTGNPLFEFAPVLAGLIEPYPKVEIVLTSGWMYWLSFDQMVSYLPPLLAARVVGWTREYKARFGYLKDGSAKTYIIRSYVFAHKLANWLAIDDSVHGAHHLSSELLPLEPHLVLLDSSRGVSAPEAQQRIREWLINMHR